MSLISRLSSISRRFPPSRNKSRLGRVASYVLVRLGAKPTLDVPLVGGAVVSLDARSRTEAEAIWNGEYDQNDLEFFKSAMSLGEVFYDIGANVGLIAIPLAKFLQERGHGKVIAFEPVNVNYQRLRRSIGLNQLANLRVFKLALGDHDGQAEMVLESGDAQISDNALMRHTVTAAENGSTCSAPLRRLDALSEADSLPNADLIKIDVEGAEVLVMLGGQEFIRRSRPVIYGEFHSRLIERFGHTFLDAYEIVKPLDYRCFGFTGRLAIEQMTPRVGLGNAVLVPAEKVEGLLAALSAARAPGAGPRVP